MYLILKIFTFKLNWIVIINMVYNGQGRLGNHGNIKKFFQSLESQRKWIILVWSSEKTIQLDVVKDVISHVFIFNKGLCS